MGLPTVDLSILKDHGLSAGYLALRESAAWFDASDRGRIRVSGEDRVRLLHAMTSNHVEALRPGDGCYAFFLNAQGRILADVNVLCFEDHLLLETEPELRAKIHDHLDRYIIADDVVLEDASADWSALVVAGPDAAERLTKLGAAVPLVGWSHTAWGKTRVIVNLTETSVSGYLLLIPNVERPVVEAELSAAGIAHATAADARVVRLEAGRARYGDEVTEKNLVQETGLMHAVHFSKGCYLGQEIVERVRSRGQVHRKLKQVVVDTDQPLEAGTKIHGADSAEAGEVIDSAYSPMLRQTVAMAYLRGPLSEDGVELVVDGKSGRVVK
jgi:aminomethyltransferase